MSEGENVKVAVRVRPFNGRERQRNSTVIVDMKGPATMLHNPENMDEEPRKFAFDYSYWSHDGCRDRGDGYWEADPSHPNGKKFCSQQTVYDNLGQGVLTNAWEGYNTTLFAYGQTGSGKSWSMVGYGINKGIVPLFTDKMFKDVAEKKTGGEIECEVMFSMLEIYNEQVRDLLNPASNKKGGLKVRQSPKLGFYAEGLTESAVGSYAEIEAKIEEGTTNRTVAATNMNATSSRAHTVVGITLIQKFQNAAGEDTTKTAVVNLVDLAGSERAESTGATGDRLKEGAAINKSLSSLGNVIAALADRSAGKDVRVPYRDSALTKLLKNALGGNSKTIMIAAVSPADINYDESLSTLRYADRAKQIKTVAKVNEDPTEKLIRELSEENERLKKLLESGGIELPKGNGEDGIEETEGMTEAEKAELKKELEEDYKAELEERARRMEEMQKTFEEKLKKAQESGQGSAISEVAEKKKTTPHLSNLNFDAQLSDKIIYFLDSPQKKVGNQHGEASDITIKGKKMLEKHAIITDVEGKFWIERDDADARILVNGILVTDKEDLDHNDRIMFGANQLYVFMHPKERDARKEPWPEVTFESAQEEIAAQSGFDMNTANKSRDDMLLQEDLMEMLPAVEEANAISQELDKKMKFEVVIASPEARGELKGRTEIMVKVTNLETDHEWIWTKSKFLNRKYVMQEMYEDYQDGDDISQFPADKDPFIEDESAEVYIGSVKIWLQSLAYMIESKEQLDITNITGEEAGKLNFEIVPCNKKGKEFTDADDIWVEKPQDMIGKPLYFLVKVVSARGLPNKFTDVCARYQFYLDDQCVQTPAMPDTANPDWAHQKQFSFDVVTEQLVDYLNTSAVMVQVWGKQKPPKIKKARNTKALLQKQSMAKGQVSAGNTNVKTVDPTKVKFMMQNKMMEKKLERLEQRMTWMGQLVKAAEKHKKRRVAVSTVRGVLDAPSSEVVNKYLAKVPKEKDADDSDSSDDESGHENGSKTCTVM